MAHNSTNEYLKLLSELQAYNTPKNIVDSLSGYLKSIYRSELENHFSAPMLWIGIYIALASLVCILAMVADLVHGFASKKLWFPCKYFRINSAFLTMISVAMKLPVDLTGSMPGTVDQVAKLGSMAFMCTMMANLLPCLATMDDNDLLSNIAALCVLVITMVVNVCIQIQTGVVSIRTYNNDPRIEAVVSPRRNFKSLPVSIKNYTILHFIYVALLVMLLIVHLSSSLAIIKSRKILESKYQQGHKIASKDIQQTQGRLPTVEKLRNHVRYHWIMARSGSSQFVFTACFPTTSVVGLICVFVTILHILTMSSTIEAILAKDYDSDYSWSMILILIVQFIGVVIGTIVPLSRCFAIFISFEVGTVTNISSHFKVFEIESYWTSNLYDWKRAIINAISELPSNNVYYLKLVIENLKSLFLNFCIELQEGVVVVCKIIAWIPFFFMICVMYCFRCLKKLLKGVSNLSGETNEKYWEQNQNLLPYVLLLEYHMLADRTFEGLSKSVDQLIQKGEKRQPYNLVKLILENSTIGFHGVEKFDQIDRRHVPSLQSELEVQNALDVQYRDCWRCPVVTLTAIAISLRNIETNKVNLLLKSVREGLVYVKLVEESLNVTYDYVILQNVAETLWKEVDLDHKWLGYKLEHLPSQERTTRQIVEWFNDKAKDIYRTGYRSIRAFGKYNDWIVCAYSMYCITKTIILDGVDEVSQEELFDRLSSMIANIIAACLTNLPQVITMKCHTFETEKREACVKYAAQLQGETTQLIAILQDHDIPNMNQSDMPFIDKWRTYFRDP